MRQIVLDTETTGKKRGLDRIIEIGCVELIQRQITKNNYQQYLHPEQEIHPDALKVHGITEEFLQDKPRFAEIVNEFMDFIKGTELIIHNANFDVSFINYELQRLNQRWQPLKQYCRIIDTLALARKRHPGQKNDLDSLCKRYHIDNSNRQKHGALLDAEILAEIYLAMTGGQASLLTTVENHQHTSQQPTIKHISADRPQLPLISPTEAELQAHQQRLTAIQKASQGKCLWLALDNS
jgi:DNA polymerase-3 subunit epsilon